MTDYDNTWRLHANKADKAREEAEFLAKSGFFDGAYIRALEACVQEVVSVAVRLTPEDHPGDHMARLRTCFKELALPAELANPVQTIIFQHSREMVTERSRTEEEAKQAIALAGTLRNSLRGAAEITASLRDPLVRRRAKAKGIEMPNPFKTF